MNKVLNNLFVYGTLRRKFSRSKGGLLWGNSNFLGEGRTVGTLYAGCSYPASILTDEGVIIGDVAEIKDLGIIRNLDAYEGYNEKTDTGLYLRRIVSVIIPEIQKQLECMIYIMELPPQGWELIADGDWLHFMELKRLTKG